MSTRNLRPIENREPVAIMPFGGKADFRTEQNNTQLYQMLQDNFSFAPEAS